MASTMGLLRLHTLATAHRLEGRFLNFRSFGRGFGGIPRLKGRDWEPQSREPQEYGKNMIGIYLPVSIYPDYCSNIQTQAADVTKAAKPGDMKKLIAEARAGPNTHPCVTAPSWLFPSLFRSPCNEDRSILESVSRPPIVGNSHVSYSQSDM